MSNAFAQGGYQKPFSGTLSQTLDTAFVLENQGFGSITFFITPPTGGAVTFEAAIDNDWQTVSMRSMDEDIFQSVFTIAGNYIGSITGLSKIRLRTSAGGSVDGSVIGLCSRQVSILEGIEFGAPPHRFGFEPIHVDASYTTQQTNTVIWTSDADKKGVVTDISLIVSGSTDGEIKIFDETDATGNYLFKGFVEVATNKNFIYIQPFVTPFKQSAKGNSFKITTSAAITLSLLGHGYQF